MRPYGPMWRENVILWGKALYIYDLLQRRMSRSIIEYEGKGYFQLIINLSEELSGHWPTG